MRAIACLPVVLLVLASCGSGGGSAGGSPAANPEPPAAGSIQAAIDQAQPGDTVRVAAGVHHERLRVRRSGTADHPIRIVGDPGAILDGTGLAMPADEAPLIDVDAMWIRIEGLEICAWATGDPQATPIGVLVHDDVAAAGHIVCAGLHVHGIVQTSGQGGAHAIAVYGRRSSPIVDVAITGCEVDGCRLGSSEAVVINGDVDGFRIQGCHVHHCDNIGIVAIGWEGTAPAGDQARNGVIADNVVHDISSAGNAAYSPTDFSADGIYVDGGRDIVIERDRVFACDLGVEVGCEHAGRSASGVTVRDNAISACRQCGIAFGGYTAALGDAVGCVFRDNTLSGDDTLGWGNGEILIHRAHDCDLRHNLLATTTQAVAMASLFSATTTYAITSDRNLVWSGGVEPGFTWNGTRRGLAAHRRATAQESATLVADPLLVAPAGAPADLHLRAGSPAIDAGDPAFVPAAGETDADGLPRRQGARIDLGAYEAPPSALVVLSSWQRVPLPCRARAAGRRSACTTRSARWMPLLDDGAR